jgi:hypothetical protein
MRRLASALHLVSLRLLRTSLRGAQGLPVRPPSKSQPFPSDAHVLHLLSSNPFLAPVRQDKMLPMELRHFLHPILNRSTQRRLATSAFSGRPLVVLGLESSAGPLPPILLLFPSTVLTLISSTDDTCAAVVNSHRQILSNVVLKQSAVHEKFGGIHPLHAQEAHQVNMPLAIRQALSEANVKLEELDGIAFTRGPGMYGCLSVSAGAAKALAAATGKPLFGVHHMVRPSRTISPKSAIFYLFRFAY